MAIFAFSPMEWVRDHCGNELADNLGINRPGRAADGQSRPQQNNEM
jgi:hypothetical protein